MGEGIPLAQSRAVQDERETKPFAGFSLPQTRPKPQKASTEDARNTEFLIGASAGISDDRGTPPQ